MATKNHGQFLLYLPAKSGADWLNSVTKKAEKRQLAVSTYIRTAVSTYMDTAEKLQTAAKRAGVSPEDLLRSMVKDFLKGKGINTWRQKD
jgi:hypothetical protein